MTEPFYVAVKASLHASDSSVFGLTPEEVLALSKRYPDSSREVINGVLIKASPLKVINSLCELGYRVVCSSGEAEIVWTLKREVLVKHGSPAKADAIELQKSKTYDKYDYPQKSEAESPKTPEKKRKKDENRLGTKPEDFAQYFDYKGSRIQVRNPSSLENIEEAANIIINSNITSPGNPLEIGTVSPPNKLKLEDPQDSAMDHSHQPINPSVHQTLSEMDFERGIWTPAMMGDIITVRQHLRKGIPADVEDMSGYTALHYAARNGHGHICSTLLDAGASIDKPTRAGGSTALHRAAMSGHVDTCDLLLRHGANPCSKDVDGRTPLHRAVERDQREVISLLIETTPATAFVKDNKGKSPLDYAEENDSLFSVFANIAKN